MHCYITYSYSYASLASGRLLQRLQESLIYFHTITRPLYPVLVQDTSDSTRLSSQ
jgi:hypothetical protein